ncbi:hypothetical protein [Hymenobacter radiodurans]|uniref:hypothetical protein n=1 Tax=Hymenobacter radiodurans TaxID=2496028 RepID=UPI002938F886|nr:hypothetical protein [Hymenobacter radiodurans]
MINTFIGDLGHISVIIAFVAAIVAAYAYYMATSRRPLGDDDVAWRRLGRGLFWCTAWRCCPLSAACSA